MKIQAQMASALRAMAKEEPIDLIVAGDCMSPRLQGGDRIGVTPRRIYLPGDIVAFRRSDDRLLVHRVLGYTFSSRGFRLLAKGDRLAREDDPIQLGSVVGRVISHHGRPLEHSMPERGRSVLGFLRTILRRSVAPWASATSS